MVEGDNTPADESRLEETADPNEIRFAEWTLPNDLEHFVTQQGEASEGLFDNFLHAALRRGVDVDIIIKACLAAEPPYGGMVYKHVRTKGGEEYVKNAIERIINPPPGPAGRKDLYVPSRETGFDIYWRKVEQILKERKLPVYVRNKRLVWPCWRWHKDKDGHNYLSAEIEEYTAIQLSDMVAHHAVQFKTKAKKGGGWRDIDPPARIIKALLEAHHYSLPDISGVITSPTLRPDLSLLDEPGYDPPTQLWYMASGDLKLPLDVPERPTPADAEARLALLNKLLDGFPFEGETPENRKSVSRSAALAGLMTAVARGALYATVPLFAVSGNEARTGKTYLIDLIGVIATGHIPVRTAGSEKKEEFEKRVETAGLSGRPILHINNLPNGMEVESERLAELSTEGIITIRKLGRHEEGQCDCRATTVFLNGNNILMASDLVWRTVTIRLKANKPEDRDFDFDPMDDVRKDRGAYLAAVFTIIKAFHAAGSPKPSADKKMKRVAGFERWSKLIQQALIWLDQPDPMGLMEEMRAMDPAQEELARLIDVLKKYSDPAYSKFTVADATKLAEQQENDPRGIPRYKRQDLRDLMSDRGKPDGQYFGRLLMKQRDREVDGWEIQVVASGVRAKAYRLKGPNNQAMALKLEESPITAAETATPEAAPERENEDDQDGDSTPF